MDTGPLRQAQGPEGRGDAAMPRLYVTGRVKGRKGMDSGMTEGGTSCI